MLRLSTLRSQRVNGTMMRILLRSDVGTAKRRPPFTRSMTARFVIMARMQSWFITYVF